MTNDEYIKALKTKDLGKLANYFWDTFMLEPTGSTKREVANARFCLLPKTIKNKLDGAL